MTSRFILRATPAAFPDGKALASRLQAVGSVSVLDQSPRMLLVDGEAVELAAVLTNSSGWSLVPESVTPVPDARRRVKRNAKGV